MSYECTFICSPELDSAKVESSTSRKEKTCLQHQEIP